MAKAASVVHALSFSHGEDAHDGVKELAFFSTFASSWLSGAVLSIFTTNFWMGIVTIVPCYAMGAGSFLIEFADCFPFVLFL